MLMRFLFALLSLAFVVPANAANHRCYGKKEVVLAKELLAVIPSLRQKLETQKKDARFVRNETCGMIAMFGKLIETDYASGFDEDTGWRPVRVAAEKRRLNPLRVQAAIVDLHWAKPKKRKGGSHVH